MSSYDGEIEQLEARLSALKALKAAEAEGMTTPETVDSADAPVEPVAAPQADATETAAVLVSKKQNSERRFAKILAANMVGVVVIVTGVALFSMTRHDPAEAELIVRGVLGEAAPGVDPATGGENPLTRTVAEAPASTWVYEETPDEMSTSVDHRACVTSNNQVNLSWPYESVNARLCIRETRKWGLDAFVVLNGRGQILCRSSDCRIRVRFDDAEAVSFAGADAADNSSNIIFFTDGSKARFLRSLKTADTTRIELTYYNNGVQVLEFNTKGLEWPRPAKGAAAAPAEGAEG